MDEVDRFGEMSSCMPPGGRILDEVFSRMQKSQLVFRNFIAVIPFYVWNLVS